MGSDHNKHFTEMPDHTLVINSPFLKPPSVSYNCYSFKHEAIILSTFISHLLIAAEEASHNMDKVAFTGLIIMKLFCVASTVSLTGQKIHSLSINEV